MFNKKFFVFGTFFLALTFFSLPLFAQVSDEDEVQNLLEEEENVNSPVNVSLQKNFVILESEREHDLNPQTTSYITDSQVHTGLYEGLFTYNPVTLEPQYAIAQNFKVSRDKKRMTFVLRQDAYFSNGEKITASSVKDSWLKLLATQNAPYASLLDIIRNAQNFRLGKVSQDEVGINVVSDYELSVYLTSPANYLPRVLCHPAFAVVHPDSTVSSGPFYLYAQDTGLLILKKNPYYWDFVNTYLEQITFVQSDDVDENAFLFNTGAVDWICENAATDKIIDTSAVLFNAQFGTSYFFFKTSSKKPNANPADFNPWDYEEFRSAVLEAFPWEEVRKNFYVQATNFVYPLAGYPEVEGYTYTDVIEATNKMKDAKAKYGIPEDEILTLTLEISEYALPDEKYPVIKNALEAIGVDFVVKKVPSANYIRGLAASNSDMFSYTWIGDFADPLAFLSLFQGDSTLNDAGWVNEEFDNLLLKAAQAKESERYGYLAEAENILLDSGMVLPLYHPVSFNIIDLKEVGGWSANAFNIHPLKYLFKKVENVKLQNVVLK